MKTQNGISFTLLKSNGGGQLTKTVGLEADGNIQKEAGIRFHSGSATKVTVGGIKEFMDSIADLEPEYAVTYGLPEKDVSTVVTKPRLKDTPGTIARSKEFFEYREGAGILAIDYDPQPTFEDAEGNIIEPPVLSPEEFLQALYALAPALERTPHGWKPSASSDIWQGDKQVVGITGQRVYFVVRNAREIPAIGQRLFDLAISTGYGWAEVDKNGSIRIDSIIDECMFRPERIDYVAPAVCRDGLMHGDTKSTVYAEEGKPLALEDLPGVDREQYNANMAKYKTEVAAYAERVRERYRKEHPGAVKSIDGELPDGSYPLMGDMVLHFKDVAPVTVNDVLDDPETYAGKELADPHEPDYRNDPRIAVCQYDDGSSPRIYSHAHGGRRYRLFRNQKVAEACRDGVALPDDFEADDFNPDTTGPEAQTAMRSTTGLKGVLAEVERILTPGLSDKARSTLVKDAIEVMMLARLDPIAKGEVRDLIARKSGTSKKDIDAYIRELSTNRLKPRQTFEGDVLDWAEDCPEWAKAWVYVGTEAAFFNVEKGIKLEPGAFNQTFKRYMPADEKGKRPQPSDYLGYMGAIPNVDRTMYAPGFPVVFTEERNGLTYANTYDPRPFDRWIEFCTGVATGEKQFNQSAIDAFAQHMEFLIPDPRERQLFLNWMRYLIEQPGCRVNWAPLLQGVKGNGKTALFNLLKQAMGDNAKTVSGRAVKEQFTAFAENAALVCFEEVRLHGENRYDFANSLKPYITNDYVSIRRMRRDEYEVLNFTSYLMLSNERDAVPISDNDRRYFVIFSPFVPKKDTRVQALGGKRAYFERLTSAIRDGYLSIAYWICGQDWHPEFDAKGDAPMTNAKKQMAEEGKPIEQEEVELLLEDAGSPYYCAEYVVVGQLEKAYKAETDRPLRPATINPMLKRMGFQKASERPRVDRLHGDGKLRITLYLHQNLIAEHGEDGAMQWTIEQINRRVADHKKRLEECAEVF